MHCEYKQSLLSVEKVFSQVAKYQQQLTNKLNDVKKKNFKKKMLIIKKQRNDQNHCKLKKKITLLKQKIQQEQAQSQNNQVNSKLIQGL